MLKNVVLPAPLGPMIETMLWRGIENVTSLTATSPPNTFEQRCASSRLSPESGRLPSGAGGAPFAGGGASPDPEGGWAPDPPGFCSGPAAQPTTAHPSLSFQQSS